MGEMGVWVELSPSSWPESSRSIAASASASCAACTCCAACCCCAACSARAACSAARRAAACSSTFSSNAVRRSASAHSLRGCGDSRVGVLARRNKSAVCARLERSRCEAAKSVRCEAGEKHVRLYRSNSVSSGSSSCDGASPPHLARIEINKIGEKWGGNMRCDHCEHAVRPLRKCAVTNGVTNGLNMGGEARE